MTSEKCISVKFEDEFPFLCITCTDKRLTDAKTDCSTKDCMFFTSFAFFAITFEPIMIWACLAPQIDHLNFSFVKDIKVVVEKMTTNHRKMIKKRQTLYFVVCIVFSFRL